LIFKLGRPFIRRTKHSQVEYIQEWKLVMLYTIFSAILQPVIWHYMLSNHLILAQMDVLYVIKLIFSIVKLKHVNNRTIYNLLVPKFYSLFCFLSTRNVACLGIWRNGFIGLLNGGFFLLWWSKLILLDYLSISFWNLENNSQLLFISIIK
jgi:hypothetical protein